MSYVKFWKCFVCGRLRERKEFDGITLKAVCHECQCRAAKPAGDTTASPQTVFVKAKRIVKTRRNHDRKEAE
jgi:hypothetical protein